MSLLIKALDKAEKAQTDKVKKTQAKRSPKALKTDFGNTGKFENLSLAEPNADLLLGNTESASTSAGTSIALEEKPLMHKMQKSAHGNINSTDTPITTTTTIPPVHPESAANVFAAKRIESTHPNTKLTVLAGVALLALLGTGWYVYQLVHVQKPIMLVRPLPPPAVEPQSNPASEIPSIEASDMPSASANTQIFAENGSTTPEPNAGSDNLNKPLTKKKESAEPDSVAASDASTEGPIKSIRGEMTVPAVASPSVSVSISRNKPEVGVNPTLMRAYEAYNAGNDNDAQGLYKQVLRQDIRNVDALLGLAAIASRQGREADAVGWYRKVLEVEPHNVIAQSTMLEAREASNGSSGESSLKAMLEKSPETPESYTKLGHHYADQNQWAAAQQAYFEAYRLRPSADNAFNLAVGLDQMGKSKLALPYYQQALELMNSSSGIDRTALEARIQAIQ